MVVFSIFYYQFKSQFLRMKYVFKHHALQMFLVSNLTNMSNFHPLEVVGRGSDAQLQVGEN